MWELEVLAILEGGGGWNKRFPSFKGRGAQQV